MINQADLKRSAEDVVNHVLIKMLRDIDENHTAEIINIIVKRDVYLNPFMYMKRCYERIGRPKQLTVTR